MPDIAIAEATPAQLPEFTNDELYEYGAHLEADVNPSMVKDDLVEAVLTRRKEIVKAKKAAAEEQAEEQTGETGDGTDADAPDEADTPDARDEPSEDDHYDFTPPEGPLTDEEIDEYRFAARHWRTVGQPEKAMALQVAMETNTRAPGNLLFTGEVRPEKPADPRIKPPPRYGPGASANRWRAFLKATADVEEEVVDRLSRNDAIAMAEAKGIIPRLHKASVEGGEDHEDGQGDSQGDSEGGSE